MEILNSDKMEIAGLIISILALLFSGFTYFIHDRKIKKQSSLINKYNLEKIENERDEAKRAIIEANVVKELKGKRVIKVYNRGKSIAKSVEITLPDNISVLRNPSPIDILPQQGIELVTHSCMDSEDRFNIYFTWNDNFKVRNEASQTLLL